MPVRGRDSRLEWRGAVELVHGEEGSAAWRLPHSDIALFPGDGLRSVARMPAGVRIVTRTDSTVVAGSVRIEGLDEADRPCVDVVAEGAVATAPVRADGEFGPVELPGRLTELELWLPQFGETILRELRFDDDCTLTAPHSEARPRIVVHGSSITQCRLVASPTRTWPAQVARELGLDLVCLGFGGECHVDQLVADVIGSLDPDIVYVCLGINVHGGATYAPRTFLPAVLGFLTRLRERAPGIPVVVSSPIASPSREEHPNGTGMTLVEIRNDVEEAVRILRARGDDELFPVDGRMLLGPEEPQLLVDGVHPTPAGYDLIAQRVLAILRSLSLAL